MLLFDRDPLAVYYKKVHVVPYRSISTSAINYMPGKVELLFSLDSSYQLHINFVGMNHQKRKFKTSISINECVLNKDSKSLFFCIRIING